jgi:AraC-like DNA-binding protein
MEAILRTADKKNPDSQMLLWHNFQEAFLPEFNTGTRFRLVLIENGSGILRFGKYRALFIAPALFCLNEIEPPMLEQSLDLQAQALYFHPNVINAAFTFENVRGGVESFSRTDKQDLYWLEPFWQRERGYGECLQMGPVTFQRVSLLFAAVNQNLSQQDGWNWICRARSFLLELLFLLDRLVSGPQIADESALLSKSPDDIDAVVLYLHTHYQKKITIAELAKTFHTNRNSLNRQFRETTGMSIMNYLIQLRIRLAALLLRDTSLSVSEILYRVGFNDSTHFGRMFRKHMGYSPTEYRQQYCWHPPHFWLPRQQISEPWRSIRYETSPT